MSPTSVSPPFVISGLWLSLRCQAAVTIAERLRNGPPADHRRITEEEFTRVGPTAWYRAAVTYQPAEVRPSHREAGVIQIA